MTAPFRAEVSALVARQREQLASELEALHDAQLLAAADDTAWLLPGVAHPKTAGGTS